MAQLDYIAENHVLIDTECNIKSQGVQQKGLLWRMIVKREGM